VLGLFDASCVVIGAIIGVGIFFTPSTVASLTHSGSLAMLAWALGGAIALCGALTFAELGGMYHASGAQYQIIRDAAGPLPAFVFVFCNATAIQPGTMGIIAVLCAGHMATALGRAPPHGAGLLAVAAALIVALALANILGVRWGSRVQNLTVIAKVAALLAVTALALAVSPPAHTASAVLAEAASPSPLTNILSALIPVLFAYGGWQQALWIGGEVRDPARILPRAIVGGVVVVIAVYLLANWAYLRLLGLEGVATSTALAADAVSVALPGAGARIIAGAVAVSAFGVLNAQLLSGPRLIYGLARDGRFFAPFARLDAHTRTPAAAITLLTVMALGILVIAFAFAGRNPLDQLTNGTMFIDVIFFALTGAALIVLRRTRPGAARPVRVPGYPLVPLLFVLGECGALVGSLLNPAVRNVSFISAIWIALATALYLVRFRHRSATAIDDPAASP